MERFTDLVSVALDGDAERTSKAQISDLEDGVLWVRVVDEQVLGLHVTVHDAVLVAVGDTLEHLVQEALRGQAGSKRLGFG